MKNYIKILICSFLFAGMISSANAQERPVHEIHAMMVYNFIKYIQWPDQNDGGEFVIGVYGDNNVFKTLHEWYDGKPKGAKKFLIKNLNSSSEAASCHVVYLAKSKNKEFENVKTEVQGKPVLCVTDGNGLGQKGSAINFKVVDGKLKFELNQSTLAENNLKASSQLSSMAIVL